MKAINGLLVSLVAGSCASLALAGGDDVTKFVQPVKMDKVAMRGHIGGSFGTRTATEVDYFSNVDLGAESYVFYGTGIHTTGDALHFEKGGLNTFGSPVGPVASPSKIGTVELWVVAIDASSGAGSLVDCTITMEMTDTLVDWMPLSTTSVPNTCFPSGDDRVNQVSLGGWYLDLTGSVAPYNYYANGYILDTGTAGLAWNCPDGNAFLDMRCWEFNAADQIHDGASTIAPVLSASVYPTYNGSLNVCSYPPGAYPALGFSYDNFWFDADNGGTYKRNERYFFGGFPALSNLMVRLGGNDGCSFDMNGDGFVSGDDSDYAGDLNDSGCPY